MSPTKTLDLLERRDERPDLAKNIFISDPSVEGFMKGTIRPRRGLSVRASEMRRGKARKSS